MAKYKRVECKTTVAAAIADAYSEVQSLRDEMSEWRDNMEEKLSNTPKFEEVSGAVDGLESFCDEEPTDIPEAVQELPVSYIEMRPYGRAATPRHLRGSNAAQMLYAVVAVIQNRIGELEADRDAQDKTTSEATSEEKLEDLVDYDTTISELSDLASTLEDHAGQLDGVTFPGAF